MWGQAKLAPVIPVTSPFTKARGSHLGLQGRAYGQLVGAAVKGFGYHSYSE